MSEMVVEQDRGWEGSHPCWNTECPTYGVAKIAPFQGSHWIGASLASDARSVFQESV